jgi:hypothetical protein
LISAKSESTINIHSNEHNGLHSFGIEARKLASDDREVVIDLPDLREMLEWKVRALAYNRHRLTLKKLKGTPDDEYKPSQ